MTLVHRKLVRLRSLQSQLDCEGKGTEPSPSSSCATVKAQVDLLHTFAEESDEATTHREAFWAREEHATDNAVLQTLDTSHLDLLKAVKLIVAPLTADSTRKVNSRGGPGAEVVDRFLARVGSLVESLTRHVVVPPSSRPLPIHVEYPPATTLSSWGSEAPAAARSEEPATRRACAPSD